VRQANAFELFGKGSVSKNYLSSDSSVMSVSMTGGFAFSLISAIRLEARYTNISSLQNQLDIMNIGTLTNIDTETTIYSLGIDINFTGEKSSFQPYIYLGGGYTQTSRTYNFSPIDGSGPQPSSDPTQSGISANVGAGLRLRLASALALEVEVFAYGIDPHFTTALINWYGTAGIRIFI
jgi:outer membrane protein W